MATSKTEKKPNGLSPATQAAGGKSAPEPGTVAGIRAHLEAARAELSELEAALAQLQAEREKLSAQRPELAARAHTAKDAAASEELRSVNSRLNSLADAVAGYEFAIAEKRAAVRALEVQAAESERAELRAARDAAQAEVDRGLGEFVAAMKTGGDVMARMAGAYMRAAQLNRQLGEPEIQWSRWLNQLKACATFNLATRHGRRLGLDGLSPLLGLHWPAREKTQEHAEAEQADA